MLANGAKFEEAVQGCHQEYNKCEQINDLGDSLRCQQDFADKYGAPADPSAAVGKCACQHSGSCVNGAKDAKSCSGW
jgi:hypothetical protein